MVLFMALVNIKLISFEMNIEFLIQMIMSSKNCCLQGLLAVCLLMKMHMSIFCRSLVEIYRLQVAMPFVWSFHFALLIETSLVFLVDDQVLP